MTLEDAARALLEARAGLRSMQWLMQLDKHFDALRAALAEHEKADYGGVLDAPEDRLWHAKDRTWWRRDMKTGRLVSAEAPVVEPRPGGPSDLDASCPSDPSEKAKE